MKVQRVRNIAESNTNVRPRRPTLSRNASLAANSKPDPKACLLKKREERLQQMRSLLDGDRLEKIRARIEARKKQKKLIQDAVQELLNFSNTGSLDLIEEGDEYEQVVIFNLTSPDVDLRDYGGRLFVIGETEELGEWNVESVERMFEEDEGLRWMIDVRFNKARNNRVVHYTYAVQDEDGTIKSEPLPYRNFSFKHHGENEALILDDHWGVPPELLGGVDTSKDDEKRQKKEELRAQISEEVKKLRARIKSCSTASNSTTLSALQLDLHAPVSPELSNSRSGRRQRLSSLMKCTENVPAPKPLRKGTTIAAGTPVEHFFVPSKPMHDRPHPEIPPPEWYPLTLNLLYSFGQEKPNLKILKDHFLKEGRLEIKAVERILKDVTNLLKTEPNVLELHAPVVVFGDIHGQYFDLINILNIVRNKLGPPLGMVHLFLGDYIDRGCFSTEVCLYLFALKINYPNNFFFLRGNHETRLLSTHFNFRSECVHKYTSKIFDEFMSVFDTLPIAAILHSEKLGSYFAVHGGLSQNLKTIEDIQNLDRFQEPGDKGPLSALLWSDPIDENGVDSMAPEELKEWYDLEYVFNGTRNCGHVFGVKACTTFLEQNNLMGIIRAHEVQTAGFCEHHFGIPDLDAPLVFTVFSAPNYCDMYANKGAFLHFSQTEYRFETFEWVEHPFYLPEFMNAITYSLPWIVENLAKLWIPLDKLRGEEEEDQTDQGIKRKIMEGMNVASHIRRTREKTVAEVKENSNFDLSSIGDEEKFKKALRVDFKNEKRPRPRRSLVYNTWSSSVF